MPTRLVDGINRVRDNWVYILQVGLAAGLAFWVGRLVGHEHPFFAPMSVVIVLSTSGGERFRKAIELVLGVSVGVGLGDLIVDAVGTGPWQIAFGVIAAVSAGMLLDRGVLVANQAAFASVLVATILPPSTSGGFERMSDAFIGGVVGLIVIALFPISPLRTGRREISRMLGITSRILNEVACELPTSDATGIANSLRTARGTQGGINKMIAAAQESKETVQVSPLMWRNRDEIKEMLRILNPVDNAIRNTRVLARRALILAEDKDQVSDEQIRIIQDLSNIAAELSQVFAEKNDSPEVFAPFVERLTGLAERAGTEVADNRVLSAQVILAQSRSIIVDLMEICGEQRADVHAVLRPTSKHPAKADDILETDN